MTSNSPSWRILQIGRAISSIFIVDFHLTFPFLNFMPRLPPEANYYRRPSLRRSFVPPYSTRTPTICVYICVCAKKVKKYKVV